MPANHCTPHTAAAKAKMSAAHSGKPRPWKQRQQKNVDGITHFRCGRCGKFLPRESFYGSKRSSLGIKSDCKPCHTSVSSISRSPEATRASKRRSESNRRARKAGTGGCVTAADWKRVLMILGTNCLCCGTGSRPTQDHIVPLAKGGLHHPVNLQPLCRPCNESKQAQTRDYRTAEQREAIAAVWVVEFKRIEGGAA